MKELQKYIERGTAMTCEELASVLNVSPDTVRRSSKPPYGQIPRIPHLRVVRFDPALVFKILSQPSPPAPPQGPRRSRSLTTEKRNISGNQKGGFRKCL